MKIMAISREPVSVAIKVIGIYRMNSPTRPGQKSRGKKTTRVVAVEEIIGHFMYLAASE
jgi:hypothetical protein